MVGVQIVRGKKIEPRHPEVDKIIARMFSASGVETLKDLGKILRTDTMGRYFPKTKESPERIPYWVLYSLHELFHVNPYWIQTGKGITFLAPGDDPSLVEHWAFTNSPKRAKGKQNYSQDRMRKAHAPMLGRMFRAMSMSNTPENFEILKCCGNISPDTFDLYLLTTGFSRKYLYGFCEENKVAMPWLLSDKGHMRASTSEKECDQAYMRYVNSLADIKPLTMEMIQAWMDEYLIHDEPKKQSPKSETTPEFDASKVELPYPNADEFKGSFKAAVDEINRRKIEEAKKAAEKASSEEETVEEEQEIITTVGPTPKPISQKKLKLMEFLAEILEPNIVGIEIVRNDNGDIVDLKLTADM